MSRHVDFLEKLRSDLGQFIFPFLCLSFFIFKIRNLGNNNLSGFVQLSSLGLYEFGFYRATVPRGTQIPKTEMERGEKRTFSAG